MSDLLRTAMFGEVIGVLAILLLYAVFVRQWAVWKIVLAQIVFGLLVYWLLSFKFEYRKMVAGHERLQDKVACLVSSAVHPLSHPVSPKIVDVVVSRLNQGRLMSLVLRYVPSQQAFVQGETIWTAAKGALIPRLFWPDKPKAGGVENIRRFMGVENLNHSINLGVVGEAYVNYDTGIDFVVFLICYVLFFRLLLLFMTQQSNKFPFLLLLLPSLFFMVNFVEKDVAIMLNHVVKQGMILGGVWICDIRFAICDLRFWPWPWGLKQHKEAGNSAQIQNPKSQIQNRKSQIISIITATYNSAATLPDTLASVAAQDYPHIEHIIVDGLSKDATLELARACPHVSRIISEADKGLYDAMNKGIAAAKGDIIGILNSDDFYTHPEVISRVVAQMEALGADLLYADLEYVDPLDTSKVVRNWKSSAYKKNKFLQGWMPPHPTLFVRREVYAQFGVFNLDFRFAADYELMLRMLHKHGVSVCYLPETIVQMRAGGLSNASLRNRWKANREDKRAWLVNALKPRFYTIWMKPLSKIGQYLG